jgi:hypothetical protein
MGFSVIMDNAAFIPTQMLGRHKFPFLLGNGSRVELLVTLCLTFWGTDKLFSKADIQFSLLSLII